MAKLGIRPVGDKVIIQRVSAETKTSGGIVLPDTAQEKPKRGIVRAVGTGRLLDSGERSKMQLKAGDEIVFTTYSGTEVKVSGQEYLIMDEGDVLAIME
jgi:chaperonin GroES